MLCGNRLCGGPLDFPAASIASRRPGYPFSVTGPFVDGSRKARARAPVAPPFRPTRAPRFHPWYCYQGLPVLSPFYPTLHTIGLETVSPILISFLWERSVPSMSRLSRIRLLLSIVLLVPLGAIRAAAQDDPDQMSLFALLRREHFVSAITKEV